ncbi:hypothetical protein ACQPW3_22515 [Actinosynnema sp. CA-248983]
MCGRVGAAGSVSAGNAGGGGRLGQAGRSGPPRSCRSGGHRAWAAVVVEAAMAG